MSKETERNASASPVPKDNLTILTRANNESPLRVEQDSPRDAVQRAAAVALPELNSPRSDNESPVMVSRPGTPVPAEQVGQSERPASPSLAVQSLVSPRSPLVDPEIVSSSAPASPSHAAQSDIIQNPSPKASSHVAAIELARLEPEVSAAPANSASANPAAAPSWGARIKASIEKLSCCAPGSRGK